MTTQTLVQTISLNKAFSIKLPKIKIRLKTILFFGFCSILFLSIFYIFQINFLITQNYLLKDLQKKAAALSTENGKLEINLAQIGYLENIQQKTEGLNFEKVQKIKYIEILNNSLAKK